MHFIVIAGTVLITVFLWISNSIRNRPPVKSKSWACFIKRMAHRHMIAIPLIGIMLILIPITFKLWGVIIDIAFLSLEIWNAYKIIASRQERYKYITSLTPHYNCYRSKICLSPRDNRKLGGNNMHYMFICQRTKLITFPESKYGNSRKYRLIKIHFKPKYGPDYLRLTYNGKNYTRKSLFNESGKNSTNATYQNKITEIPTVATIILESKNENQPIIIHLHNEIIDKVHQLKRNCLNQLTHHRLDHQELNNDLA